MAKQSGLGDNFYVGGFDLSGDVASVDKLAGPLATIEATGIKQFAENRIPGLRDGSMQFTTLFNNTGSTATPGFPTSTTPVTNTNAWPVFVTIAGGTLTSVKINGTQVGTTAGTYVLPVGSNISVTYTVAPTWNWVGVLAEHNALSTLPTADTIGTYFRGTTLGNPVACCNAKQVNYDGTRDNTGALTFQSSLQADGFGLEWGIMLTPGLRADTAATVGAAYTDVAASNFGAQAYVQLVALVGTNVDISITHCATVGGTYTSLFDFGSMTTPNQSKRLAVSNTTTVNQFFKVVTTGTFTYAQFAVALMRNPIAGVVF